MPVIDSLGSDSSRVIPDLEPSNRFCYCCGMQPVLQKRQRYYCLVVSCLFVIVIVIVIAHSNKVVGLVLTEQQLNEVVGFDNNTVTR